ncbi:hypothetical protein JOB18_018826 [Solea senegalensis]|uniref:Uncharacterized protein n=1 Tax=Solea senegalensis TaxID=28829 RepID=A0AAV6RND5_SOLSE|nr:hypothetical protein JOB18_018826 [Solea senegalensis]
MLSVEMFPSLTLRGSDIRRIITCVRAVIQTPTLWIIDFQLNPHVRDSRWGRILEAL